MPYFTNGIEVNDFKDLKIFNFKGTGSPVNLLAFPVKLEKGEGLETDERKSRIKSVNVK